MAQLVPPVMAAYMDESLALQKKILLKCLPCYQFYAFRQFTEQPVSEIPAQSGDGEAVINRFSSEALSDLHVCVMRYARGPRSLALDKRRGEVGYLSISERQIV